MKPRLAPGSKGARDINGHHSRSFFIWLQLELCAMAVLLTKGECRGTACRDWGLGVGGSAVGLGERR